MLIGEKAEKHFPVRQPWLNLRRQSAGPARVARVVLKKLQTPALIKNIAQRGRQLTSALNKLKPAARHLH